MKAQSQARKQRLAAALRTNLKRRKAAHRKPEGSPTITQGKTIDRRVSSPEAATKKDQNP